jgi:hypothetical protein
MEKCLFPDIFAKHPRSKERNDLCLPFLKQQLFSPTATTKNAAAFEHLNCLKIPSFSHFALSLYSNIYKLSIWQSR